MNFIITPWSKPQNKDCKTHQDLISEWMGKRGHDFQDYTGVPRHGWTVSHDGTPVAVMGLRLCEGNVGLIDTFCSDPEIDPEIRNHAADALTCELLDQAELHGLIGLIGISRDQNTIKRSVAHGFDVSNQVLFSKKLGKKA